MKLGAEFQVNTSLGLRHSFSKENPAIAQLSGGDYMITWDSEPQDGDGKGIYGQMYNADGSVKGVEFKVNTTTFRDQQGSSITALTDGDFLVSWNSNNAPPSGRPNVYAQRFNADGTKSGEELKLGDNDFVVAEHGKYLYDVAISALDDGGFVAAWRSEDFETTQVGTTKTSEFKPPYLEGQIYGADSVAKGDKFIIAANEGFKLYDPSIALLENGDFILSYIQSTGGSDVGELFGQRLSSAGVKIDERFQPTFGTSFGKGSVTGLASGGFVYIFQQGNSIGGNSDFDIFGQLFNAAGEKQGDVFKVSQVANSWQISPNVVELNNGDIAVSYQAGNQVGSNFVIVVKILDSNGVSKGAEFVVSDVRAMEQLTPDIAAFGEDGFITTWAAGLHFNGGQIIFGRIWDDNGTIGGVDVGGGSEDETGSEGADIILQYLGDVALKGQGGSDKLVVLQGVNNLDGGADSDFLIGGIRKDLLDGGNGNDVIMGDASDLRGGADRIIGGKGDDGLMGGLGADIFVFNPDDGKDFIADFDANFILKNDQSGYSVRENATNFTRRTADFETSIDIIELNGFTDVNASNVMDFVNDGANGAVFSAQGTEITFYNILTSQLAADDFLFV